MFNEATWSRIFSHLTLNQQAKISTTCRLFQKTYNNHVWQKLRRFYDSAEFLEFLETSSSLNPGTTYQTNFVVIYELKCLMRQAIELLGHHDVYRKFQYYRQKFEIFEIHTREHFPDEITQIFIEFFNLSTTKEQIIKNSQRLIDLLSFIHF
jgi:hypothetical protein